MVSLCSDSWNGTGDGGWIHSALPRSLGGHSEAGDMKGLGGPKWFRGSGDGV